MIRKRELFFVALATGILGAGLRLNFQPLIAEAQKCVESVVEAMTIVVDDSGGSAKIVTGDEAKDLSDNNWDGLDNKWKTEESLGQHTFCALGLVKFPKDAYGARCEVVRDGAEWLLRTGKDGKDSGPVYCKAVCF